jgi:hypothetical protein
MGDKTIHFTLDLEADLGTAAPVKTYEAAGQTGRLVEIAARLALPLTVFCEGEILEKHFAAVEPLLAYGAEIELHAYDHTAAYAGAARRMDNLRAGLAAYQARFGRAPRGFRAPNGMIAAPELRALGERGVEYDSSIFPTRFPGRFDFRRAPRRPFRVAGTPLVELPFATIDRLRVPIALSYFQLLGPTAFKALVARFGAPDEIVFDFHMHDLVHGDWRKRPGVSRAARLGYWRAQAMADPAAALIDAVRFFTARGYRPEPLSALAARCRAAALPEAELA